MAHKKGGCGCKHKSTKPRKKAPVKKGKRRG